MQLTHYPRWQRLSVAPVAVLVALGVRLLLVPLTGAEGPFLLFFSAIMFSAWVGGRAAGLFATALAAPLAAFFFLLPGVRSDTTILSPLILITLFVIDSLLICTITSQIQTMAERAARHEVELVSLINGVQDYAIFLLDPVGQVVSWNSGAERIKGYTAAEIIGQPFTRFYLPDDVAAGQPQAALQAAATAGCYTGEGWQVRKDGTRFWASVVMTPLHDTIGTLTGFAKVTRDSTELRRHAEALRVARDELETRVVERTAALALANATLAQQAEELRTSEARFQAFMDHSPTAAWITDAQGIMHYASATYRRIFAFPPPDLRGKSAFPPPDLRGKSVFDLYPDPIAHEFFANIQAVAASGEALETIERLPRIDGHLGEFLVYTFPLAAGTQSVVGGLAVDITQLRETEVRLRASLHEKEVLLKEIHHRVKNNLQVVMSLLRLQSRQVTDPLASAALRDSRQRVEVMALVHDLLYRTGDMTTIDADTYIQQLSKQLLRIYGVAPDQVTVSLSAEGVWLNLDQAIPCGLIINELFSNSLKYAFPNGQPGTLGITLHADSLGMLTLKVWDTGIGRASKDLPTARASLGITLVHDLVRQLRGSAVTENESGVAVTITFPQGAPSEQVGIAEGAR